MVRQSFYVYVLGGFARFAVPGFDHERCTAIQVGSIMILSVYLPHSEYDEENHIGALEIINSEGVEEHGCKRFLHWRRSQYRAQT